MISRQVWKVNPLVTLFHSKAISSAEPPKSHESFVTTIQMMVECACGRFGVEAMLNIGLLLLAISSLGFGLSDSVAGRNVKQLFGMSVLVKGSKKYSSSYFSGLLSTSLFYIFQVGCSGDHCRALRPLQSTLPLAFWSRQIPGRLSRWISPPRHTPCSHLHGRWGVQQSGWLAGSACICSFNIDRFALVQEGLPKIKIKRSRFFTFIGSGSLWKRWGHNWPISWWMLGSKSLDYVETLGFFESASQECSSNTEAQLIWGPQMQVFSSSPKKTSGIALQCRFLGTLRLECSVACDIHWGSLFCKHRQGRRA